MSPYARNFFLRVGREESERLASFQFILISIMTWNLNFFILLDLNTFNTVLHLSLNFAFFKTYIIVCSHRPLKVWKNQCFNLVKALFAIPMVFYLFQLLPTGTFFIFCCKMHKAALFIAAHLDIYTRVDDQVCEWQLLALEQTPPNWVHTSYLPFVFVFF